MDTNEKIIRWFLSGDTGRSSIAIVSQMTGIQQSGRGSDYPRDAGDFGRCHRLLEAVPEFRARIEEMAQRSPQWAELVKRWDTLAQLYLTDRSAMYVKMRKILDAVPNENIVDLGNGVAIEFMTKD